LGARYAPRAEIFLAAHAWLYTLFVFALLGFFAVSTMRALRAAREAKAGN
jgi:cell division septal protein FtsQ